MFRGYVINERVFMAFCLAEGLFFEFPATRYDILARYLSLTMLKRIPFEALCWITGLLVLAILDTNSHFTVCPFKNAGWDFCPGCGLGRSISLFFRGDVSASFEMHPLGIFAVFILSFRIINLLKQYLQNYGKSY